MHALEPIFYLVMLFNVFQALFPSEAVNIGSLLFREFIHHSKNVSEGFEVPNRNSVLAHTEFSIKNS